MRSTGSKPFKEGKFTSKSIMKTSVKNTFLLPALVAALGMVLAGQATAQIFTNVYTFSIRTGGSLTNSDGAYPESGLTLSGNTLYGTTHYGGGSGLGTVYSVNTGGTVFSNLYSFPGGSGGLEPTTGLVLSGNMLYGSASPLFGLETNGTGFTNLFSFPGTDAANLNGLILSGGTLYGTSYQGGTNGVGTIFPSTSAAIITRTSLVSRRTRVIPHIPTPMESIPWAGWFYRATPCTGRHRMVASAAAARCSPSTPMAWVLRTSIISRHVPARV
jgi:uncharacterized repeat protein (TIGR03803 family)